jgi:hypothetical protein
MAAARPLLKLGAKKEAQPEPKDVPVFDPDALAAQAGTDSGTYFVQGKNLFTLKGVFVKEAPENLWYITTPQQEANNRAAKARQRASAVFNTRSEAQAVPDKVLEMAKENARAFAAESHAE